MDDHNSQRDVRMAGEFIPHCCMAVQIDIGGHGRSDFCAVGLGHRFGAFTFQYPLGLLLSQIALMKSNLAIGADAHIDASAFALGRGHMLIGLEILPDRQYHHIAPAIFDINGFAFFDLG
jgi:hypothetical protein